MCLYHDHHVTLVNFAFVLLYNHHSLLINARCNHYCYHCYSVYYQYDQCHYQGWYCFGFLIITSNGLSRGRRSRSFVVGVVELLQQVEGSNFKTWVHSDMPPTDLQYLHVTPY